MKKRINLIIIACLLCAILLSLGAPLALPTFAAFNVEVGSLLLGVTMRNFGMQATLKTDYINYSWEAGDISDTPVKFWGEKYPPLESDAGYCYMLQVSNAEYDYDVTVREYSNVLAKEEYLTNEWICTTSLDIDVKDGYFYTVEFTKREAYVDGMYYVKAREIYFWLPETETYDVSSCSNVLDDLQKDEDFNAEDYPAMPIGRFDEENNPSLQVIQIAEGANGELFLYTYQPFNKYVPFTATSISMYCGYSVNGEDFQPQNYDLTLVSSDGVFCKYLVNNFKVSDEAYRYYNIVCIRREFNDSLDEEISGTEENGNEKAISVGQQWCCYYLNNQLIYEMNTFDTLKIKVKYTGNFEFSSGITWGSLAGILESGNSWFICFDLEDYIAEHIYDADMSYTIRESTRTYYLIGNNTEKLGDPTEEYITLTDKDTASYQGNGLFAKKYSWNRIMTSAEFIKNAEDQGVKISDEAKQEIENSQWVFSFAETESSEIHDTGYDVYMGYDIDDVSILRIHFLDTDHKTYNLGVVSDRVNPDNTPDGYGGLDEEAIDDWVEKLLMLVGIVALFSLLSFLAPVVSAIFKLIWTLVKMLFKGVFVIISLPLEILGKIFKTKK